MSNTTESEVLSAIGALRSLILDMQGEIKELHRDLEKTNSALEESNRAHEESNRALLDMQGEIKELHRDLENTNRAVQQTRIMSGSLVETNIRNYFIKEYGESFARHYSANDLSGLIYLATPRALRKRGDGYQTLMERRNSFVEAMYRSCSSFLLYEYLCGDQSVCMTSMHENLNESLKDEAQSDESLSKKNTKKVFASVLYKMLQFPKITINDKLKIDHASNIRVLHQACGSSVDRSIVFALITSLIVKACATAVPKLNLEAERIWDDKQLEFDLRGHCEIKPTAPGVYTVVVRTGEVKSSLTNAAKAKAKSQLVVRSLTIALTAALCDSKISHIESECILAVFNASSSFDVPYCMEFQLGSNTKPRKVTATLRLTTIIPPNTCWLKDLNPDKDTY